MEPVLLPQLPIWPRRHKPAAETNFMTQSISNSGANRIKLAYLVSHPIQYQSPMLRRIAQEPDIELTVFFGSGFSVRGYKDTGFGVDVKWDVPLLEGYHSEFLPLLLDTDAAGPTRPLNYGIFHRLRRGRFDALWVHGYSSINALHGILAARALCIPVLLRAESWLSDRTRGGATLAAKRLFFVSCYRRRWPGARRPGGPHTRTRPWQRALHWISQSIGITALL
jgi:hypothetical protein